MHRGGSPPRRRVRYGRRDDAARHHVVLRATQASTEADRVVVPRTQRLRTRGREQPRGGGGGRRRAPHVREWPRGTVRERTFVFGKHTGSLAVSEKLLGRGVEAAPEQVAALVKLIKDFAEARSKGDQQAFVISFRDRAERRRGVTDDEFWTLAQKAGLGRPRTAAK